MREGPRSCAEIYDPTLYERGQARALFARLRADAPVWWTPMPGGGGFWSVLSYTEIRQVAAAQDRFSSARRHGGHRITDETEFEFWKDVEASMLSMDEPEHARHRALVAPAFTASKMAALEGRIRERTRHVLERLADCDTCDFVSTAAAELPIQVIAELLGVPQEDRARLFEWSNALVGEDDPELRPAAEHLLHCKHQMWQYALKMWRERLRRPSDDLVTRLVYGEVDGANISVEEYFATFYLLVVAGNESVRNSLSGGLLLLSEHWDERQRLLANPALFASAAREIVRYVSPFLHVRRTAIIDSDIAGQPIACGDKVVIWFLSGNFDETAFDQPERFDITRRGEPHLGFGFGAHYCLGSRLAELQLRVFLEELLTCFPDIAPCGPVRRVRSNFVNGIKELPVRPGRPRLNRERTHGQRRNA